MSQKIPVRYSRGRGNSKANNESFNYAQIWPMRRPSRTALVKTIKRLASFRVKPYSCMHCDINKKAIGLPHIQMGLLRNMEIFLHVMYLLTAFPVARDYVRFKYLRVCSSTR